jgi:hypothetical protein
VGAILFTSAGKGWAFGPALWQTCDGGAAWRKMSAQGFDFQEGVYQPQAWLTSDGGRHWAPVTVR